MEKKKALDHNVNIITKMLCSPFKNGLRVHYVQWEMQFQCYHIKLFFKNTIQFLTAGVFIRLNSLNQNTQFSNQCRYIILLIQFI